MFSNATATRDAVDPQKSVAEKLPKSPAPRATSFTVEYVDFGRDRAAGLIADALYMQGLLLKKMATQKNAAKGSSNQPEPILECTCLLRKTVRTSSQVVLYQFAIAIMSECSEDGLKQACVAPQGVRCRYNVPSHPYKLETNELIVMLVPTSSSSWLSRVEREISDSPEKPTAESRGTTWDGHVDSRLLPDIDLT
ncbi:hypothetical protein CC80DRAFT_500602 [Byssothecium circinans]|uniref:Uncharacterized protein n=1 Tax=Byssothecium circinans TaxID=147558 RepID=A0A6A5UJQ4_9PLEO|nr:hypothetical protein CC80DRAFT_500602 [Byssothecium circinans]